MNDDFEYYLDSLDHIEHDVGYHYYEDESTLKIIHTIYSCISNSVLQIYWNLSLQIAFCLILAAFSCKIRQEYVYQLSAIFGLYLLYIYFASELLYILAYTLIVSVLITNIFSCNWKPLCYISLIYILWGQFALFTTESWDKFRGAFMIIIMKSIFLTLNVKNQKIMNHDSHPVKLQENKKVQDSDTTCKILSYLLDPSTLIFGPWQSYMDYKQCFIKDKRNLYKKEDHHKCDIRQFRLKGVFSLFLEPLLLALLFFSCSSCLEMIVLHTLDLPFLHQKWVSAYLQAFSFRAGHYFICYFSQALVNIKFIIPPRAASEVAQPCTVTQFTKIECPRSLVDVCYYWNMPMSAWLKSCVFEKSRLYVGTFAGILLTYLVSSLLHGFNFRISAILLSLGLYTYAEYETRKVLSQCLNACVGAKACKSRCQHKYKDASWTVKGINYAFSALAILHLTYLGAPFGLAHHGPDTQGGGLKHTLACWASLDFLSHKLMVLNVGVMLILKKVASYASPKEKD